MALALPTDTEWPRPGAACLQCDLPQCQRQPGHLAPLPLRPQACCQWSGLGQQFSGPCGKSGLSPLTLPPHLDLTLVSLQAPRTVVVSHVIVWDIMAFNGIIHTLASPLLTPPQPVS